MFIKITKFQQFFSDALYASLNRISKFYCFKVFNLVSLLFCTSTDAAKIKPCWFIYTIFVFARNFLFYIYTRLDSELLLDITCG